MGTKNKDEELVEIQILTEEQVDALPKDAVTTVRSLKGSLPQAQLEIFIPVVQKYMELRDLASKLKLEKDEDGKISKESITAYKEVKKEVGAFNGELKRKIKDIKDPLNAIKNDVLKVEKTFKSESDKIKDAALTEFAEYEEEIERKKKAAQEKKDAALKAEVDKANEETEKLRQQGLRTETINNLKYKEILEGITQRANDAVANANERSLNLLKQELINTAFEDIKKKYDVSMIDAETLEQIGNQFSVAKVNAQELIQDKLNRYEEEREKEREKARNEYNYPTSASSPGYFPAREEKIVKPTKVKALVMKSSPQDINEWLKAGWTREMLVEHGHAVWMNSEEEPEQESSNDISEKEFIDRILGDVALLQLNLDTRIEKSGITPGLAELKRKFNQFNS